MWRAIVAVVAAFWLLCGHSSAQIYGTASTSTFGFSQVKVLTPASSATLTTPTPTLTGVVVNQNGGVCAGVTVLVYVGVTLDGTTATIGDCTWSYTIFTPLSGSSITPQGYTLVAKADVRLVSTNLPITIAKVPSAPTDLRLDLDWINSGEVANTQLGKFYPTDTDVGDTFTYSLTDDAGGRFAISGGLLIAGATPTDYSVTRTHNITVLVTDSFGLTFPKTLTIRVFPVVDFVNAPAAVDPSTLSGLVLDINPVVGKVTVDGSNNVGTLITSDAGAYTLTQATTGNKPVWVSSFGPNNQPALTMAANKFMTSSDAGLLGLWNAAGPKVWAVIIADTTLSTSSTPQRTIQWEGATSTLNPLGLRVQDTIQNGNFEQWVGDSQNLGPAVAIAPDTISTSTPYAFMGLVTSGETIAVERDFVRTSRGSKFQRGYPNTAVTTTIFRLGDAAVGHVGHIYRILFFNRPPNKVERFQTYLWAHNTYGTPAPVWTPDLDLTTGYTQRYAQDFNFSSPADVTWGNGPRNERGTLGMVPYPPSSNNANGGMISPPENAWMLDASQATFWQYENIKFRNHHLIIEIKPTPATLVGVIGGLVGFTANPGYISGHINSRYGEWQGIYGCMEIKSVFGNGAGAGTWYANWMFRMISGTKEADNPELFGQDQWNAFLTAHDASFAGGSIDVSFPFDDFGLGEHYWTTCIGPVTSTWYIDHQEVFTFSTPTAWHQPAFWNVNLSIGLNSSAFSGAPDGTTKMPQDQVVDFIHWWEPTDQVPVDNGSTPAEATAIFAASASTGCTLDATHQAAISKLINKMKSVTFTSPNYTSQTLWDLTNFMFNPADQCLGASLLNWKTAMPATVVGSPTLTADRGVQSGGAGNYWDTGINLTTAGLSGTPTNFQCWAWTLSNPAGTADDRVVGTTKWGVAHTSLDTYMFGGIAGGTRSFQGHQGFGDQSMTYINGFSQPWFEDALIGLGANQAAGNAFDNETWKLAGATAAIAGTQQLASTGCGQWLPPEAMRIKHTIIKEYLHTLGAV